MATETPTTRTGVAERPASPTMRLGPLAFVVSGVGALGVTVAAATVSPDLVQPGTTGYVVSGGLMTLSDFALLVGIVVLARSDAVRRGALRSFGFALAILGSLGILPAEVELRINHDAGNAAFQVVGPIQALGLILVGIGIALTRSWTGWRRFITLALGIYVPAILVPSLAASNGENLLTLGGYHLLVLALGVAFWQESDRAHRRS